MKWLTHIPQGQHEWRLYRLWKKYHRENHKRVYEGHVKGSYLGEKNKGQEELLKITTKFMVKWVLQNYPRTLRKNVCHFILPISAECYNTSIWSIFAQVKCGGTNVPEFATSEIPNSRGTNVFQRVLLGQYKIRVEFDKYGFPPVGRRAPS